MPARDPWFDNAKMALVTLAVVGHAWSLLLPDSTTNSWLYDFLYVWHMPAFVLVSGYFSRSFDLSSTRVRALVATLVVPFVVYQAALAWFQAGIGWGAPEHPYLQPLWPLWYLVALVLWRLAAPAFLRLPAGVAIAAAVAISLVGGTLDLSYLSLSRVVGMLPFFVIGLVATPEWVARVRTPAAQQAGVVCLLLTLWVVRDLDSWAGTWWLYFRPYDVLAAGPVDGMLTRAALLGLALGCSLGALSLVPGVDGWFARMGAATMVVYLVHGFVVRGVDAAGVFDWTTAHPGLGRLVVVPAAVGLALALASPPAVRRLGPLVDPVGWWRGRARPAAPLAATRAEPVRAPRPTRTLDPTRLV
ncbi:acyltransferase family protein [Nocardioides sp.]|uniref:acyltransferase family protein n=1 Tax=Nocardioides sp. TaxID=35761 RepID=UPI002721E58D|nr:acyltransferase family protein [Nocardioides sp.]MDO9456118.1 acyltransferase family protein [Nocardioides sp.]